MSIDTNFNVNPYYDDFDEDKKFLRMLFKPGYAVQARELTQAQTILQKQIERFGNHVFKNGSVVTGGSTFLQDVTYIKLDAEYAGSTVTANNFVGTSIVDNISTPTKRAEVVKVYDADAGTGDPKTLLVKQIYGEAFTSGDTILTYESSPTSANIATSGVGTGQVFSVNEGVFYYDGFFIKNDTQTIATSKYSNTTANAKIGFEITESTISSSSDTSLLDPAQDASNYQAPGSDRFKINLVLATRSLTSTDTTQFIELARVENGYLTRNYRFPIYSVLEDQMARRTYDESGNYTVRPFRLSLSTNSANTANLDVTLSPGKAYIYGYEYETISPTTITVAKPRDTESVQNKRLTGDYGNFLYTTNHTGSQAINDLSTLDLHCVNVASINTTSTATISNTKIGTARVLSTSYDSSSNTSDSSTYSYKTFLFDVKVNSSITGNVNVATTTTVTIGNTAAGEIYSDIDDAYVGASFTITTGDGSTEEAKTITNFDQATQTLTVTPAFTTTPSNTSVFSIDFEVSETESLATFSGTTVVNNADVDTRSKDAASTYNDTYLADSEFQSPIISLGESFVDANSFTDFSYSYKKLYQSQAFSANVSPALSVGSGESISSATTSSAILQNYQVVVTNAGTSPYAVGEIISADKITDVDTGTRKITISDAQNMTANIIATIDYTTSGAIEKSKTVVAANSTVQTTGGESINSNGVIVYSSQGQTTIEANNVIKTTGTAQSLYVSDVIELVSVYDFDGSAVANTGYTDVTGRYSLDNGQRDSFYDHANIKLKPGYSAPNGPLVVRYNKLSSSGAGFFTANSYISVTNDPYINYGSIPTYTSPKSGKLYTLRDSIDFRPVRSDATAAIGTNVVFDVDSSTTGPKVVENGSDIVLDFAYYLPRIDKVALFKNRTLGVIKGDSSKDPVKPKNNKDSMNLYILNLLPYVSDSEDITVEYVNNRRYTMRDIGNLDTRIGNLEYYTSLSLLEQDSFNKQDLTILDTTNLPRFKNGIIVDGFKGSSVADVTNADYKASIDVTYNELRPSFNVESRLLTFDSANSSNYLQGGPFVTIDATETPFVEQDLASKTMNINPFNIVNYIGKITLNPPTDVWVDTSKKPDVLVNLEGDRDAWDLLIGEALGGPLTQAGIILENGGSDYTATPAITFVGGGGRGATAVANMVGGITKRIASITLTNGGTGYTSAPQIVIDGSSLSNPLAPNGIPRGGFARYDAKTLPVNNWGIEWSNWETVWTGTEVSERLSIRSHAWIGGPRAGRGNIRVSNAGTRTTIQTTQTGQTRTGITTTVGVDTITQSLGDRVVDVSVIPYMRKKSILFTATDFKPDTELYSFFDNQSVETYVARANKIVLADNDLDYNIKTANTEDVTIVNTATTYTEATAVVVQQSNNTVFVVNFNANTGSTFSVATANLVGSVSGASHSISEYHHYSGLANAATSTTITLSRDVDGATNRTYYGNTANSNIVNIVDGTGAGQQRTIDSYDHSTRTITVSTAWDTTPDTSSVYSIGRLTTTRGGDVSGVYNIPSETFRTGEKLFRLIDDSAGDIPSSSTNGDASFYAQGLLQTQEEVIVSTLQPTVQRTSVNDERVTSSTTVIASEPVAGWYDPLAQTFLVAPAQHPQGIFLDRVRVCFKTKDETVPVTLQLRPTVNGYPSSTTIYPYGSVTLTPDKVKTTDSPDFDDATKYTDFIFETPIYVLPGEHAFVLVSNCNSYEAYVAEVGKLDIVSGTQISEQPYGGSFFMSQNGSTWTADQNMDIAFRIFRKVFDTSSSATVKMQIDRPYSNTAGNTNYDLVHMISSEVVLANTALTYSFVSEKETGGFTGSIPIQPLSNYEMNDGNGRRVLNANTGNTTLVVTATLSTVNPDVSPIVDTTRYATTLVENTIDALPLKAEDFVIEAGGSGYANSADVTVTITGGNGSGAVATATVVSNVITGFTVTNGGSGYTTSPTITLTPGSGGGSGAIVTYNGEDKKSGGNSKVRYMTRKVTLADGFDSGDLRVYLTAYKPSGSNIYVYYKPLSSSDPDSFDDKNYVLMTELGNESYVSTNERDYRELTFAPGSDRTATNKVTYTSDGTTYNSFKTFAIKVVMSGDDPTDVPKIRDFRAIALPAEA